MIQEPDPTTPDPVAYFKAWLEAMKMRKLIQTQIIKWMESDG